MKIRVLTATRSRNLAGRKRGASPLAIIGGRFATTQKARYPEAATSRYTPNCSLNDSIEEPVSVRKSKEIIDEMANQPLLLIDMPAGCMWSDVAVGRAPQRIIRRKRLGIGHIQICSAQMAAAKGLQERWLIHRASSADVVED